MTSVLGQQESGGDQVAELFKIAFWLVAISEPVECVVVFLGELVAQFVGQGEVLAAAVRGWRVQDDAVVEERDPVAPASRIPALGQLVLFPDTQPEPLGKRSFRVGGEGFAVCRRDLAQDALGVTFQRVHVIPVPSSWPLASMKSSRTASHSPAFRWRPRRAVVTSMSR